MDTREAPGDNLALNNNRRASGELVRGAGPSQFTGQAITSPQRTPALGTWRVSVVIPTRNEAVSVRSVLNRLPVGVHEVIVVDGHSTDGTVDVVRSARPDAVIVEQKGRGKGDALRLGFEASTGNVIAMLDADGSMDPAEIPRFVDAITAGADFVKGSRYISPYGGSTDLSVIRNLGNRGLLAFVNLLYRTRYSDLCYGYNVFRTEALRDVMPTCDGFEVETFMTIRASVADLTVAEVPSFEVERHHGASNLHAIRDGLRVARTICGHRVASLLTARRRPSSAIDGRDVERFAA